MIGKNNYYLKNTKEGTKVESYSIKKFKVGAASVVIGASIFFGAGAVAQASGSISSNTATDELLGADNKLEVTPKAQAKPVVENTRESAAAAVALKLENSEKETLNKTALTKLIEEIDVKFTNGKYASKTEESVKQLKATLEEARTVLSNAKTQAELSQAQAKLVTATTKLQTKQEDKKQVPAVDTTNGKPTVGLKATNTEKFLNSNSIANSGSRDERHGKALDRSNPFRADAATTDADPDANQTYTAPAENANLKELVDKLLGLGAAVENNTKLAKEMNTLGDSKQVAKGTVKEIKEFGGWTAVDGGVFAIARRTEEGVYPLETINSTLNDTVWLREQAFDRDTEYTLLLSKSRTRANRNEEVFDGSKYQPTGVGSGITKNIARYKGIEKTFTAYSTAEGSDIIVKFKPGYVGDSDGSKANYKVQVYSITGNQESLVYETTFDPSIDKNDTKYIVTKATDGTNAERIKISEASNSTTIDAGVDNTTRPGFIGKREAEKLMAQAKNLPNGKAGTFTSKPIALPQGADHYKVRISLADQNRTGMSYQAWDEKYSIPVTGADFSIAQDTSRVAKSLLQRVYDKLLATLDADKRGKTPETQAAYQAQLDAIKEALKPENLTSTKKYQDLLKLALETQSGLKVDKSALTASKGELDDLVNDDPTPGKTPETVAKYNEAKTAAEEEAKKAKAIIDSDKATVDEVAQAVANVRAKRAELQTARALLVVAATEEQKTKLKNDSDALKPADTNGKTPKSIEAYNTQYRQLEDAINKAKAQAKKVLDKEANAGEVEATDAQIEVDKIKAKLDKAAALLKDKGDTAGLETAKNELKTATEATNVTDGKTKESADKYNEAKKAAEAVVKEAEGVIADVNSTTEDVANALAKVNAAKEALADAKSKLVEAAAAKAEIEAAKAAKEKAIDANPDLTPEQKTEAKAKVAEEAAKAIAEIHKATTAEAVTKAKEDGKAAIEKAAAKAEIEAAKAAKEKAIDANPDLTPEQKTEAKAKVAEEATKAIDAIDKATTAEAVTKAKEDGKAAIEKAVAKAEIEAAKAAKEKAIDARTDLLPEEKEAAKKAAREEAEAAKNAIDKATTSEDINKVLEDGKENIAKINPIGAKEEAKKAVEEALANKEKEIDESTDLTPEEKVKAKALAREEAKAAKEAIDKATSIEGIEKALRPFLYQIDQDALVFNLPTFNIEKALKSLINGNVSVEQGKELTDQDILSKLDLPEGLEVVKIEKPTTDKLGVTSAKVTIKLSDGSYAIIEVPVEVVKKSIDDREENRSNVSKENSKTSKNTLPNTGATETNTGLAGLGMAVLGGLLAVAKRRREK